MYSIRMVLGALCATTPMFWCWIGRWVRRNELLMAWAGALMRHVRNYFILKPCVRLGDHGGGAVAP